MTDPKMPEPVAYACMWPDGGAFITIHHGVAVRYMEATVKSRPGPTLAPLITTEASQAYAEALAAARVAQERERCVAWIEARKDAFCDEHGYIDPDTGFLEFGRGAHAQAKHDYVSELEEIADGLRALSTQPPETGKEQR